MNRTGFRSTIFHSILLLAVLTITAGSVNAAGFDITVRLESSTGAPLEGGDVYYYLNPNYYLFGTTDTSGQVTATLPITPARIRVTYEGISETNTDAVDIGDGYVVFQTSVITVTLKTCEGVGLEGGVVTYWDNAHNQPFGTTDTNGEARREMLTGSPLPDWKLKYAGANNSKNDWNTVTNPVINFLSTAVTLVNPVGGNIQYWPVGGPWLTFNQPTMELLPSTYNFKFLGGGAPPQQNGVVISGCAYPAGSENSPPVAVNNNYTVLEDGVLNTGNVITDNTGEGVDSDADSDPLTAAKTSDPSNGALTLNGDGSFTYTPGPDYCGPDNFTYKVNDGDLDSVADATVSLTVTCVNDEPSFTKGADESVLEDAGAQTVAGWATAISTGPANESGQNLAFHLTNDNNSLFSVQPGIDSSGQLTYTPAADANGSANVTVYLTDDGGTANGGDDTSDDQYFVISVTPVNDAPDFTVVDPSVNEDAGPHSDFAVSSGFVAGPGDESGQKVINCLLTNFTDAGSILTAQPVISVNAAEDGCEVDFDTVADQFGSATFDLQIQDDGGVADGGVDLSAAKQVTITVGPVNDEPDFVVVNPSVNEDTGPHTGIAVTSGFDPGPANESSQTVIACLLTNFSDLTSPNNVLTDTPVASVNGTADGCVVDFDTALNQYGSVTFDLQIQDSGGTANSGDDKSPVRQVTITVDPVNDAPFVESVTDSAQTVQYSDDIDTVTILVRDIDSPYTDLGLTRSGQPFDIGDVVQSSPCQPWDSVYTGVGSECTWTLDGQVLVPGDTIHVITFTPNDADGDGTTGTHTLTVEPEDATVKLDNGNDVAVEVQSSELTNEEFSLYFTAWETNNVDPPFEDSADMPAGNANARADADDFIEANVKGTMTLSGVGPGGGDSVDCTVVDDDGDRPYGEYLVFECTFPAGSLGVNTYEVEARVDGFGSTTRYFAGIDEDAFIVYDPNAGFTTGGGWFYWPDTDIPDGAEWLPPGGVEGEDEIVHPCADGEMYYGDRTNFGYTMKYNKKGTNIQGSALVMRHTMVPWYSEYDGEWKCIAGDNYRVKSNALYGLAIGEDADNGFGYASFAGKATYREPGMDNEGNHTFFIYAEDHGEQGCGQESSDRFWIEVWNKDDLTVMQPEFGQPGYLTSAAIECGNIVVPHAANGGGNPH